MIYLPPFYEPDLAPVYKIGSSFYEVTTLKLSKYDSWQDQALFGIPFNPTREWKHQPILVRTRYGGFILETPEEGKLNIGSVPVKRSLSSPFLNLYLIKVPETELPPPNEIMFDLLHEFIHIGLSLKEYLGHIPIQDDSLKVSYDEIAEFSKKRYLLDVDYIPKFENKDVYTYANIILIVKRKDGEYHITVAQKTKTYAECHKMAIGNF